MKNSIRSSARPALLAIGVLGFSILPGALGVAQDGAPPPRPRPPVPPAGVTAAHYFKNIKVLQKLPANQLIPAMQRISASLGVRCDFCHAMGPNGPNFISDEKPAKNVARQMVLMTNSINAHQKILNNKATCYMCHHGHPQPETQVPPRPEGPGGRPPAPPTP